MGGLADEADARQHTNQCNSLRDAFKAELDSIA